MVTKALRLWSSPTGQITPSVFADDCVFVDPTTNVKGPEKYSRAVASLFDPDASRADLISAEVRCLSTLTWCPWLCVCPLLSFAQHALSQVLDPHTLRFRWRFDATLRSPVRLKFKPYTGTTIYRTNADGLIAEHLETWCVASYCIPNAVRPRPSWTTLHHLFGCVRDISAADAFISALIPSFGAPPAPPVDPLPL